MASRRTISFPRLGLACLLLGVAVHLPAAELASPKNAEFFETRVRPVLVEHCHSCHSVGAKKLKAELRLDSSEGLLAGGESGPVIIPGDPARSPLLRALTYEDSDLQMPPKTRLAPAVVEDFRRWIREGAAWPATPDKAGPVVAGSGFDLAHRKSSHWAWQPIRNPSTPEVRNTGWPADELDRFILARLEAGGLSPAPPAEPRTLLRRAAFALTGLPPDSDAIAAFTRDPSPTGFARIVDRWLASPGYGERWARHWLDKVRYAETMGHEFDYPILNAWRYRDYVVRAFRDDLPYPDFVREQIAGDLLPPRWNQEEGINESLVATMQFWLPQQVHSPVDARAYTSEVIDNQIDVLGKAFLGLTLACARCHDHKFDAISARDYYALHGILDSSRYAIRAIDSPARRQTAAPRIAAERDRVRHELADRLLQALSTNAPALLASAAVRSNAWAIVLPAGTNAVPRPLAEWFAEGDATTLDHDAFGQPTWIGTNEVRLVSPGTRNDASLSRRYQGALRSPTFDIDRPFLHLRVAGRGTRFSVAIEGFTLIQAPIYGSLRQNLQKTDPHWVTLDLTMWRGRRAWISFSDFTASDPATDVGADARRPDGWFAVGAVVQSNDRQPPRVLPPSIPAEPAVLVQRWRESPASVDSASLAWLESALRALPLPPSLFAAWNEIESVIAEPQLAATMTEGTPVDDPVFVRGNHKTPGELVRRRFLEAIPLPARSRPGEDFTTSSGRLALAEAVAHPENPLPARVMVNWIWAHLFGRGLVASVDNFGVLGERPTHPELLDRLAADFRTNPSVKSLIRRIVLSRTWQMASQATDPGAEARDPDNLLWHRANLRRLEGEAIRDAMLAVSGRLDPKVGGPPIPTHLTPFMDGRGRPGTSGPLDGDSRRSIYLEVRRNFASPFLLAFDAPVPFSTVGRRTVSNVPAQALALMNDPFVAAQARHWADRAAREVPDASEPRVRRLYEQAFAREPSPDEIRTALEFVPAPPLPAPGSGNGPGPVADHPWADLTHVLFNSKEFIFLP